MNSLIYALIDPRTEQVHYVGKSRQGLRRPRAHLQPANYKRSQWVYAWVRDLRAAGLYPVISILDHVTPAHLSQRERDWIATGRALGWPLCNQTRGGEGTQGHRDTAPQRQRKALAAQGHEVTPTTRAKIADTLKGHEVTEAARVKMARAKGGKPIRAIDPHTCAPTYYDTQAAASRALDLPQTAIWAVLHGVSAATRTRGIGFEFAV